MFGIPKTILLFESCLIVFKTSTFSFGIDFTLVVISGGDRAQDNDTAGLLIAPDGTEWHQLTLGEHSSGRFLQQSILIESSGPSR